MDDAGFPFHSPFELDTASCHPETFILKGRLSASPHTVPIRYRMIALKIPTWEKGEMGNIGQFLFHNMEEILLDITEHLLPGRGQKFLIRPWFCRPGRTPLFIVLGSPGHLLGASSLSITLHGHLQNGCQEVCPWELYYFLSPLLSGPR